MAGFKIYISNKNDVLADILADKLKTGIQDPFRKEQIIVQSLGMAHWLKLKLAELNGIFANMEFPFPKAFINSLFSTFRNIPEISPFQTELMTWKLMRIIPEISETDGFDIIKNYIHGQDSELKTYQLSSRIAYLFDQYQIYRPDIITQWNAGFTVPENFQHSRWQAALWRELARGKENFCYPALKNEFALRLQDCSVQEKLPERIFIFGISTLPPYYIDIFNMISEYTELNFFYLNPCREYWENEYSPKELGRLKTEGYSDDELYLAAENNLLASMGRTGREFFSLLLSTVPEMESPFFMEPGEDTLLHALQSDVLNLKGNSEPVKRKFDKTDRSIRIHSCHSALRELEVLKDNILALIDSNSGIQPENIVVMMPDISLYAPMIESVFALEESTLQKIPYSIADRTYNEISITASKFISIMKLHHGRLSAPDLMDLLGAWPVMKKFALDEEDMELIKKWISDTGIRWGADEFSREEMGLQKFRENTWAHGLDQMLAGYALSNNYSSYENFISEIVPYDRIEGDTVRVLGSFSGFLTLVFKYIKLIREKHTPEEWGRLLTEIVDAFFIVDEDTQEEIRSIKSIITIDGLLKYSALADFTGLISAEVITDYLEEKFQALASSRGFMRGGITFCTLLPMRSIPFKAVFLLGMNSGDYPRSINPLGFDMMEKKKRLCDHSPRNNDRYLFLEAMLAAENYFVISYVGQSIKDNSVIPPSVLVEELMDCIDRSFESEYGKVSESLIIKHPLQPFNPVYFRSGNSELSSYSSENCEAAKKSLNRIVEDTRFISETLPDTFMEYWNEININDIVKFFRSPCEFLLRIRLSINLASDKLIILDDTEDFELDGLDRYLLKDKIIQYMIEGRNPEKYYEVLKLKGGLPFGHAGKKDFESCLSEAGNIMKDIRRYFPDNKLIETFIDINVPLSENETITVNSRPENIFANGQLFYFCSKAKAKNRLKAWIHHLVLNCAETIDSARETYCFFDDCSIKYPALSREESVNELSNLLKLFRVGWNSPLPFFPELSYLFCSGAKLKSDMETEESPYIKQCFPILEKAFDSEFENTARTVFEKSLKLETELS